MPLVEAIPATSSEAGGAAHHHRLVAAMFSLELNEGRVDYDTVEDLHQGRLGEWVTAVHRSGLLSPSAVDLLTRCWHQNPRLLFDALLDDADEITRAHHEALWAALDDTAPLRTAERTHFRP
ncbi:hypothetical protein [Rhodococcus jostii]